MHDWTISRQLWWGHRIPVWYGPDGEPSASGRTKSRRATAGRRTRTCWTPGSPRACGRSRRWAGREHTDTLRAFYPTSVLVTGYDILFFWVARMMMFGMYAMADSRSAGAVRCGRAARPGARPVRQEDVQVQGQRGRPAGLDREVRRRRGAVHPGPRRQPRHRPGDRRGMGGRLAQLLLEAVQRHQVRDAQRCDGAEDRRRRRSTDRRRRVDPRPPRRGDRRAPPRCWSDFQFGKAAEGLYHFAWDEFCDWYLELAKVPDRWRRRRPGARPPGRCSAPCWTALLRLLHPFVPFVTETLWTSLTGGESLVIADWPTPSGRSADAAAPAGSPTSTGWSPRSAGSAPTRAYRPTERVPAASDRSARHHRPGGAALTAAC